MSKDGLPSQVTINGGSLIFISDLSIFDCLHVFCQTFPSFFIIGIVLAFMADTFTEFVAIRSNIVVAVMSFRYCCIRLVIIFITGISFLLISLSFSLLMLMLFVPLQSKILSLENSCYLRLCTHHFC